MFLLFFLFFRKVGIFFWDLLTSAYTWVNVLWDLSVMTWTKDMYFDFHNNFLVEFFQTESRLYLNFGCLLCGLFRSGVQRFVAPSRVCRTDPYPSTPVTFHSLFWFCGLIFFLDKTVTIREKDMMERSSNNAPFSSERQRSVLLLLLYYFGNNHW